jgi:hypothetical protein
VSSIPSRSLRAIAALCFSLVVVLPLAGPAAAAPVTAGYRDFSYAASGVSAPTSEKPQSKLWYADGSWWGALFSIASDAYNIYRLNSATQTWVDTGVVIDTRNAVRLDALWDGTRLYVAAAGKTATSSDHAQLHRFSYNPATDTYTQDAGFPVQIVSGGMEAGSIAKDSSGVVWFTFTRSNAAWVARTNGSDTTWSAPYTIPVAGSNTLTSDDESAIVSFNGKIGVMWSNQNDWVMHFAIHADGAPDSAWVSNSAVEGDEMADDHMNLKADAAGNVYAVTKTSLNAPTDPLILVSKFDGTSWTRAVFATVSSQHTRAQVLLDEQNRQLYVLAAAPCCSGGIVYYKRTSMDAMSFSPGLGTPFIQSSQDGNVNNISSTKQPLNGNTGLVAIAGDDRTRFYLHGSLTLGGGTPDTTPPETTITAAPSGDVGSTTASIEFTSSEAGSSFTCSLDGGAFSACTSPATYSGLALGPHSFRVVATDPAGNPDPTPASASWTVVATTGGTFLPVADTHLRQASANTNYGTVTELNTDGGSGVEERALLKFTLTGSSGSIVQAKLRVWVTNGTGNGPQVVPTATGWAENTVTWNSAPALLGAPVTNLGAMALGSWVEIDVTSAITGDGTYAFTFVPESTDAVRISSREATNRPQLIVTWAP